MVSQEISSAAAAAAANDKPQNRKQSKPDDTKLHRSIFDVPADFFDSCRLLHPSLSSLPDSGIFPDDSLPEPTSEEVIESTVSTNDAKAMQRWSCSTCKAEFDSLLDQRLHFKSDLHRFNIKLSIAGKAIIKEEDFDEENSDLLCKDHDVSSISGSEDEDEREANSHTGRQNESSGISKQRIFVQLQKGDKVSVWRCLVLDETEHISFETDKSFVMDRAGDLHLTPKEVTEKLKYILHEPRDNTCLRIVILATGGHFAGCVFDGNSLVAHKTFHRYVVRAKAGKKQSSKDGGGRAIHSAGASLRRYNELAFKKDVQELLISWKPYFTAASCIFIYAPSNNRQLFFDGEKSHFPCQHHAIRNIPFTVRRPTLKEARRIYSLLAQISPEASGEIAPNADRKPLSCVNIRNDCNPESSKTESRETLEGQAMREACSTVTGMDGLSLSDDSKRDADPLGTLTPLHEAAKSGDAQKILELLEQGLDPCAKDERGRTPYVLASDKEVRNNFRRFMASNLDKWDWHAAKVPSALTKEMEESQAAKQAEKDAKKKARAKELKKLKKAKEKKAQAEASQSQKGLSTSTASQHKGHSSSSSSTTLSKEEERRTLVAEREKRAAAAERRIAAAHKVQETTPATAPSNSHSAGSNVLCSCCNISLAGKVPFHRYHYKYCSTSCMHAHREILECDG